MQDWRHTVGANIKRLRTARKLTQEKLAGDAQIDVTYLRGIEAGRRNPSLMVMGCLAAAMNADITEFFDRTLVPRGPIKPLPGGRHPKRDKR